MICVSRLSLIQRTKLTFSIFNFCIMFRAANNIEVHNISNPISKWVENIDIEGLTLFDIHRQPRKILDDHILDEGNEPILNYVDVPEEVLESLFKDDLKCGVCLGTLQTTLTSTACLHRFCSDCLHRSLRMELGAKMHHECPSCRTKLASRRASKPDLKYDKLIQLFTELAQSTTKKRIFSDADVNTSTDVVNIPTLTTIHGNNEEIILDLGKYRAAHLDKVNEFRERQAKLLYNQQHNKLGTRSTSAITLKKQLNAIPSKSKLSDNINGYDDKHQSAMSNNNNQLTNLQKSENKVWMGLYPNPEWIPDELVQRMSFDTTAVTDTDKFQLTHPYLKLAPHKTISSLKSYLTRKLKFIDPSLIHIEIIGNFNNHAISFDEGISVFDITTQYWDCKSELKLYFQFNASNTTNTNDNI